MLKEVTNATEQIPEPAAATEAPAIFKQRPGTVATFSRKKRLDQVLRCCLSVSCAFLFHSNFNSTGSTMEAGSYSCGQRMHEAPQAGNRLVQGVLQATNWALEPPKPSEKDAAANTSEPTAASLSAAEDAGSEFDLPSDGESSDDASSPPTPQQPAAGRRYPRKVPASAAQREADANAQFLASMRTHFEQARLNNCTSMQPAFE